MWMLLLLKRAMQKGWCRLHLFDKRKVVIEIPTSASLKGKHRMSVKSGDIWRTEDSFVFSKPIHDDDRWLTKWKWQLMVFSVMIAILGLSLGSCFVRQLTMIPSISACWLLRAMVFIASSVVKLDPLLLGSKGKTTPSLPMEDGWRLLGVAISSDRISRQQ